jgi:hypothetical protein
LSGDEIEQKLLKENKMKGSVKKCVVILAAVVIALGAVMAITGCKSKGCHCYKAPKIKACEERRACCEERRACCEERRACKERKRACCEERRACCEERKKACKERKRACECEKL